MNVNNLETSECVNNNEVEWLLDSGCTDHIVNNKDYFSNHVNLKSPIAVKLPDGKHLKATKVDTVKTIFKNYYDEVTAILKNVYYAEEIQKNLLSFSKITERSTIVAREDIAKIYNKNRKLIAVASKNNGLYTYYKRFYM